jgi:hypothetical protein
VGMSLITISVAAPSAMLSHRLGGLHRHLRVASGAVSLIFGVYLAHRIGITDGLFGGRPTWTPR